MNRLQAYRSCRFGPNRPHGAMRGTTLLVASVMLWVTGTTFAQSTELKLDAKGEWVQTKAPAPGSDEAVIAKARALIVQKKHSDAKPILTRWIEANEIGKSAMVAEAYLLRGDCWLARGDEEEALRDWEVVVRDYPASEHFASALERELEVARAYLKGKRRKVLGMRLDSGIPLAEEIILRINERLPGSRLAESALIELADYYYGNRDLSMAAETYDAFVTLYPRSEFREHAMQRQIFASISKFKGPRYDGTGLTDAKIQISRFSREFPATAERMGMSETLVQRLDEASAATQLDTAKFYLKRADKVSARMVCRKLLERFPGTESAQQALEIMQREGWDPAPPRPPATGAKPAAAEGEAK